MRLVLILLPFSLADIAGALPSTAFWNNEWPSDTTNGDLDGTVLFAQGQVLPSHDGVIGDDTQPHLTALRQTLVMFQPSSSTSEMDGITMKVKDEQGAILASDIAMEDPENIPKQDGWLPNISANLTFPETLSDPYIVQYQSNLDQTNDPNDQSYLIDVLNAQNEKVQVKYWDGSWASDLYLPDATTVPPDSVVLVTCDSSWSVRVNYPNTITGGYRTQTLSRGTEVMLVIVNSAYWIAASDLEHNDYVFGHGFWTATLEATWVRPGMTLEFSSSSGNSSELVNIDIGGETELIITAIDVGFLTEPRNEFTFKDDETTHREYYQTNPASRLIVAQYESLHLEEVMLPTGVLYTTSSADTGGWHSGDMRQFTGKILISHGIDMANYGYASSSGTSESSHTFTCALLAGHNTVGQYTNGRVVHGGSGGNGMITLDSSVGNEFSHEAGHNFGLGHYVRGFEGSVHRAADQTGSTWGWDADLNTFIPNFYPGDSGANQCCCPSDGNSQCEAPFMGKHQYGRDSMAGGSGGHWGINRFTMYTPNSYKRIQSFLESKLLFHPDSATGFIRYNPTTRQMDEANHHKRPAQFGVPVTTLVGYYDPQGELTDYIFPAMHGAYGFVYEADATMNSGNGCELLVQTRNAGLLVYNLDSTRFSANAMNKYHVNIATADEVMSAEIQCNGVTHTIRQLNGIPAEELTYTRNGQAIEPRTFAPTDPPSASPTTCLFESPSDCGCDNVLQSDYRGTVAVTKSGRTCQRWDEQFPHTHSRTSSNFPDKGLIENYCRNPDGEPGGAWCYTTDPNKRWEYCDVPSCAAPTLTPTSAPPTTGTPTNPPTLAPTYLPTPSPTTCPFESPLECGCANVLQNDYRGTIAVTASGRTCQRWDEQYPHGHSRTAGNYPGKGLIENYCRNPDNEPGGAWCYTTDSNKRWEYCDIPTC